MNLVDIAKGWYYYIKGSAETKQLMQKRLAVCDTCEYKHQIDGKGLQVLQQLNEVNNLYKCGLCNCPLGPLSSLPKPGCKAYKWNQL